MEDNIMTIPYIAYEAMLDKEDRQQRRLVVIIAILVVLLVGSNIAWLIAWNQYDYVEDYTEVDGGNGVANYIGDDGDINYGTSSTCEAEQDAPQW